MYPQGAHLVVSRARVISDPLSTQSSYETSITFTYEVHLWNSPAKFTCEIHLRSSPMKFTCEVHLWNSPTKFTYEIHLWSSPMKFTYEIHLRSSPTKFTYEIHLRSSPMQFTYEVHLWSSPASVLVWFYYDYHHTESYDFVTITIILCRVFICDSLTVTTIIMLYTTCYHLQLIIIYQNQIVPLHWQYIQPSPQQIICWIIWCCNDQHCLTNIWLYATIHVEYQYHTLNTQDAILIWATSDLQLDLCCYCL